MTPDELRELDRRVALEVMGDVYDDAANVWAAKDGSTCSSADGGPRRYSTDLNAAWAVVERMGLATSVCNTPPSKTWFAFLGDHCGDGDSVAEAVCKAALRAAAR